MFTIEIAGIPIGIESRFGSTRQLYRDYLTSRPPWVTVSASEDEMEAEGRRRRKRMSCFASTGRSHS